MSLRAASACTARLPVCSRDARQSRQHASLRRNQPPGVTAEPRQVCGAGPPEGARAQLRGRERLAGGSERPVHARAREVVTSHVLVGRGGATSPSLTSPAPLPDAADGRSEARCARLSSICDHADRLQRGAMAGGIGVGAGSEAGPRAVAPSQRLGWRVDYLRGLRRARAPTTPPAASLVLNGPSSHRSSTWMGERGQRGGRSIEAPPAHRGACAVARRCWRMGVGSPDCADGWVGRAAIGMPSWWSTHGWCAARHLLASGGSPAGCRRLKRAVQFWC